MSKILLNDRNVHKSHRKLFIAITAIFVLAVIAVYVIIAQSGHWIVEDDKFDHVKWAVILDGQSADMERNDYVANQMKQGKIDSVVIMGRRVYRTLSNAEFYVEDFIQQGDFDSNRIFLSRHDDPSTISEARTVIPWLKSRNIDTVLLITATQATKRAAMLFRKLSGEKPVYITADIKFHEYNPNSWFFNRESRKHWIREWASLLQAHYDLIGSQELTKDDYYYFAPIQSLADEHKDESVVDLQELLKEVEEKNKAIADSIDAKDSTQLSDSLTVKDSTQKN